MSKRPEHLGYADVENAPETARKLIEASRRLLLAKGWDSLTIPAVCREAGVYLPAVSYYFGGKQGLIAVVFDSIMTEFFDHAVGILHEMPSDADAADSSVEVLDALWHSLGSDAVLAFFETLPFIVRDPQLTALTLKRYQAYEDEVSDFYRARSGPDDTSGWRAYPVLLTAVLDGLSIRHLLDPDSDAPDDALRLFQSMLRRSLGLRAAPSLRCP